MTCLCVREREREREEGGGGGGMAGIDVRRLKLPFEHGLL